MVNDINGHIENIKIFTDYRISKLSSIEIFWDFVEKGGKPLEINMVSKKAIPFTEKELEDYIDEKPKEKKKSDSDQYVRFVKDSVEKLLNYSNTKLPDAIDIEKIYYEIILKNVNLFDFLQTSQEIFDEYVRLALRKPADIFFSNLQTIESQIPNTYKSDLGKYIFPDKIKEFEWLDGNVSNSENVKKNAGLLNWVGQKQRLVDYALFLKKDTDYTFPNVEIRQLIIFLERRYNIDVGTLRRPSKYSNRKRNTIDFKFFKV